MTPRGLENMKYTCPLCGQPVSPSKYQEITGIWKERQRLLDKVKRERKRIQEARKKLKERLKKQAAMFKKKEARRIREAVQRQTKRLKQRLGELRRREDLIKKRAREAAQKFVASAVKKQLKEEREKISRRTEKKYKRARQSLNSALSQIQIKSRQLRLAHAQITELKRQLRRQTTPQLEGLLYEDVLAGELKKRFRRDEITHTGKGGDVIQCVMLGDERIGLIVYECKRVKHHSSKHVKQAVRAKEKRKADFAVLVTSAVKRGTHGFFMERGVIVVHPTGVLPLVGILRGQIVEIARMKLGREQKDEVARLVLEYLSGPEFTNSMDAIIQESLALQKELVDEIKRHEAAWKKRHEAHTKIHGEAYTVKGKSKVLLSGKLEERLAEPSEIPELPLLPEVTPPLTKKKKAIAAEAT